MLHFQFLTAEEIQYCILCITSISIFPFHQVHTLTSGLNLYYVLSKENKGPNGFILKNIVHPYFSK
jgi:hypothetical protein